MVLVNLETFLKNPNLSYTRHFLIIAAIAGRKGCILNSGLRQTWPGERSVSLLSAFPETKGPDSIPSWGCVLSCSQPIQKAEMFRSILSYLALHVTNFCFPREIPFVTKAKSLSSLFRRGEFSFMKWWWLKWGLGVWRLRHQMWMSDIHNTCQFSFCSHAQKLQNYLFLIQSFVRSIC